MLSHWTFEVGNFSGSMFSFLITVGSVFWNYSNYMYKHVFSLWLSGCMGRLCFFIWLTDINIELYLNIIYSNRIWLYIFIMMISDNKLYVCSPRLIIFDEVQWLPYLLLMKRAIFMYSKRKSINKNGLVIKADKLFRDCANFKHYTMLKTRIGFHKSFFGTRSVLTIYRNLITLKL